MRNTFFEEQLVECSSPGGGGGNSSSTLVPMREQENAYKGVSFRDERVYARIREKGGKIDPKQEKGCFSKIWEKNA